MLSHRERLVTEGRANGAIGIQLGISETTVKTHLQHAFGKLEARDRAHAVTIARDRRLL